MTSIIFGTQVHIGNTLRVRLEQQEVRARAIRSCDLLADEKKKLVDLLLLLLPN